MDVPWTWSDSRGPTAEKKPALLVMLDEPQDFGITWISWFQWYTEWEMRFTIQIFGNIGNIWDSRWFHEWENYGILMIDWWMLFRVTETQNTLFQCLSALDPPSIILEISTLTVSNQVVPPSNASESAPAWKSIVSAREWGKSQWHWLEICRCHPPSKQGGRQTIYCKFHQFYSRVEKMRCNIT